MKFLCPIPPSGFIFIEVLVALVLLSGGVIGGLEMTRLAQIGLDSARDRVIALTFAQSLLEEKAALSYEQILGGPGSGEEGGRGITREWEISSSPSGLRGLTIRVTTRWTGRAGASGGVVLNLFRPGGRVP